MSSLGPVYDHHTGPSNSASYKVRRTCRLCNGPIAQVLELAPTPPANELLEDRQSSLDQDRFPLGLWGCQDCGHVQLPVVVDPDRIFRVYPYVSGTSPVFIEHLREYAESLAEKFGMEPGHLVVEVGSNDGTFLKFFRKAGMRVLGVDPARNIAAMASASGVRTIPEFMDVGVSRSIVRGWGKASLVVANNVFAHSDDLDGMARAVREVLHPFGVFVFEVQYLVDLCDKALFDMVYHEHMSYHHVGPLVKFFGGLGMRLFDVERVGVHGGSIRCYVDFGNRPVSDEVNDTLALEDSVGLGPGGRAIVELSSKINKIGTVLTARLDEIRTSGKRVVGYGAPAKACTLSHHFGLDSDSVQLIVDDNPLKQGRFLPGKGIPILPPSALDGESDYLLILAWNYADDIMGKPACAAFRERGGRFIVPLPEYREVC
jgi:SAM-dependent methyltransferase